MNNEVQPGFSLPEAFAEHVKNARQTAMEAGMREVTFEIRYHLPDNPNIIGMPFMHQITDFFAAGENIINRIDSALERSKTLITDEIQANAIADEFEKLAEDIKEHLERVQSTPDEFMLQFNGLTHIQRAEAIEMVPLKKLRDFLKFWEREIDGPLAEIKVGLTQLPESEIQKAFLRSVMATENDSVLQGKARGLIMPSSSLKLN